MTTMIRTQVSLYKNEYLDAKKKAKELTISLAEYIRRRLRDDNLNNDKNPAWAKYAGIVQSGDANSSKNIDDIVYGDKP